MVNPEDDNDNYHGPGSDLVNRVTGKVDVDVLVGNEGSIYLFQPLTPRTSNPTRNGSVRH